MTILKYIGIFLLGIGGPILCYILVYGSILVCKYAILRIKAKRFRKRVKKMESNLNKDDLDAIEVEVVKGEGNVSK